MSKLHSQRALSNTLGFFMEGVPVTFVKNTLAFPGSEELKPYLDYYRHYQVSAEPKPPFRGKQLCESYEHFVTTNHELRHFHDALLCRALFEHFILAHKRLAILANLMTTLDLRRRGLHIPLESAHQQYFRSPDGQQALDYLRNTTSRFQASLLRLDSTLPLGAESISLLHLIETNAIITELIQLIVSHGVQAAEEYYHTTVVHLGEEYRSILEYGCQTFGDLLITLETLYTVIGYSLCSEDPVQTFSLLMTNHHGDTETLKRICGPDAIADLFKTEESLERRIQAITPLDSSGRPLKIPEGNELGRKILGFPQLIYELRKNLIEKYVREFRYNAQLYLQNTDKLPSPALLFYPDDKSVLGIQEQELKKRGIDYLALVIGEDEQGEHAVVGALTSILRHPSSIDFEVANMHLLARYCYYLVFEEEQDYLYHPLVDERYHEMWGSWLSRI